MNSETVPVSKYSKSCMVCWKCTDSIEQPRTLYRDRNVLITLCTDDQSDLGRCIITPLEHISPRDLWTSGWTLSQFGQYVTMMESVCKSLYGMDTFDILHVNRTVRDENGNSTLKDAYQHISLEFVPRYGRFVKKYGLEFIASSGMNRVRMELSIDMISKIVADIRKAIEECPQKPPATVAEYA